MTDEPDCTCAVCGFWADPDGHRNDDDEPMCDECYAYEMAAEFADRIHDERE